MPKKNLVKPKNKVISPKSKVKTITPQTLRGMRDILPEDQIYWEFIRKKAELFASAYGFKRIDTPALEEESLFRRSVGEETDIVEKEMYTFLDKSGDKMTLRPEFTAGITRAYIEHGFINLPQPVKLFTLGPVYRYNRPQAGRFREFYQFNFEILGDGHPVIDAQLILMVYRLYKELGIEVSLQVNSIGHPGCRVEYKKALLDYYKTRKKFLCHDCKKRIAKNPLRLLDCKVPDCKEMSLDAPQIIDHLDEECHEHFVKVLEHLDEAEVPYNLNPRVVRGLDYYTRTTFEVWPQEEKKVEPQELGGGGRYDNLIESLGGRPTPAVGFAGGIDRIVLFMKEENLKVPPFERPLVFLAQLGESARKKSLTLFEELRKAGIKTTESLSKDSLKSQLGRAAEAGARFTLILGQKEILDKTILLRDMDNGAQEIIDYEKIISELQKRISRGNNLNSYQEKPPS